MRVLNLKRPRDNLILVRQFTLCICSCGFSSSKSRNSGTGLLRLIVIKLRRFYSAQGKPCSYFSKKNKRKGSLFTRKPRHQQSRERCAAVPPAVRRARRARVPYKARPAPPGWGHSLHSCGSHRRRLPPAAGSPRPG